MRKVVKLDVLSVVRLFVIFYAAVGLFASVKAVLNDAEKLYCPFGFEYPFLYYTVNINFTTSEWPRILTGVAVLIAVLFYAITGAISGATAAFAYNLTSRFWPGISAEVKSDNQHAEPAPQIPPALPTEPPPVIPPSC